MFENRRMTNKNSYVVIFVFFMFVICQVSLHQFLEPLNNGVSALCIYKCTSLWQHDNAHQLTKILHLNFICVFLYTLLHIVWTATLPDPTMNLHLRNMRSFLSPADTYIRLLSLHPVKLGLF